MRVVAKQAAHQQRQQQQPPALKVKFQQDIQATHVATLIILTFVETHPSVTRNLVAQAQAQAAVEAAEAVVEAVAALQRSVAEDSTNAMDVAMQHALRVPNPVVRHRNASATRLAARASGRFQVLDSHQKFQ